MPLAFFTLCICSIFNLHPKPHSVIINIWNLYENGCGCLLHFLSQKWNEGKHERWVYTTQQKTENFRIIYREAKKKILKVNKMLYKYTYRIYTFCVSSHPIKMCIYKSFINLIKRNALSQFKILYGYGETTTITPTFSF